MGTSVKMMLMGVTLYPALRVNSVMITLHHWLEQNVLVLMAIFLTMIQNVLVSYVAIRMSHTLYCMHYNYFQQTLMSAPTHQLLIVLNSVLILLVVMSVIVMMATEQLLTMIHSVKV